MASAVQDTGEGADEPLAQAARLAHAWAGRHCVADAEGRCCDAYHGFWPSLRLMGMAGTLAGHAALYRDAMAGWAAHGARHHAPRRVLISGCADCAMLAQLWHATSIDAPLLDVTVLDICPTPLALNRWYAQRIDRPLNTVCSDILSHRPATGYDLIVTSSFLGHFSPSQRPALFRAYRSMLRDGGQLVTSNRLRPLPEHTAVGFTPTQARRFARIAGMLSPALPPSAALTAAQARAMALAYARHSRNFPVASEQSIRDLASASGMQVVRCDTLQAAPSPARVSGPTLGDGSRYVFVVLAR